MKYCSSCGEEVHLIIPEGDNRYRHVCKACDTIHYQNPKVVTGCIAEWQDKVASIQRHPSVLSGEELSNHKLPEMMSDWLVAIEKDWQTRILEQ